MLPLPAGNGSVKMKVKTSHLQARWFQSQASESENYSKENIGWSPDLFSDIRHICSFLKPKAKRISFLA